MQNQSEHKYYIQYLPVDLPPEFPLFEHGEYVPPLKTDEKMHYHKCLEIGYCYKGSGIFFVDDKILPFSAGDVSIIFSNEIHNAISAGNIINTWKFIMVDPVKMLSDMNIKEMNILRALIQGKSSFLNIISKDDCSGISALVFEIFSELNERKENYRLMIKSLIYTLGIKLSRFSQYAGNDDLKEGSKADIMRIAPALNYVSDNYMNTISVSHLAHICNLSIPHFRRLFYKSISLSPSDYIHMVKIKLASMMLLNTEHSVLEISLDVGFSSISSFNRQFKKIMGASPREWKRNMCADGGRQTV